MYSTAEYMPGTNKAMIVIPTPEKEKEGVGRLKKNYMKRSQKSGVYHM